MPAHRSPLRSRRPLRTSVLLAAFAAIATLAGGCGGDRVSGADQRVPANLELATGTVQSAGVATDVPTLPVFRVTDEEGEPVIGALVRFSASHGGTIAGDSVHTSASGFAAPTRWTLGEQAVVQTLTARVGTLAPATATIRGTADVPAAITRTLGLAQDAVAGEMVSVRPEVRVADRFGNRVAGALVTFEVTAGGGSIPRDTVRTDSSGVAAVDSWTLGTVTGENTLTARVGDLPPVTFTALGTSGAAANVAVLAGGGLSATVGTALPDAPVVRVTDANGNPIAGIVVTFATAAGSGAIVNASDATDDDGRASAGSWTLGTTMGVHTLNVTVPGLAPLMITATATAGAPATVTAHAGDGLSAVAGTAIAAAPAVRVTDVHGNPVAGAAVTFAVTAGNGALGTTDALTDVSGIASAGSWTLGTTVGMNTATATVTGLASATFTATGTAGAAATIAIVAGDAQTAAAGTAVAAAPSVRVRDANGNAVAGASVVFTTESGGGSVTGGTVTTDAAGLATMGSWTLGTSAGTNTLLASTGALPAVRFTATARAAAAASVTKHTGDSLSATVGTATVVAPAVLVRDAFGNPVAGVTVTFAVAGGGGSVGASSATTDAAGIASAGSWTLGTVAGANTVTATVAGLAAATFTATSTPALPATITKVQGDAQVATAGTAVDVVPGVRVTDAYANPVAGVQVSFAVATGGGSITGATAITNASGVAAVGSWTLGTTAGLNTLTASTPGVAPATFSATGIAGAAAGLAIFGGNGGTAQVGTTRELAVRAADIHGNGVEGLAVTWGVSAGVASPAGSITDANGVARTTWTFGAAAGTQTASASVPLLAGSPATFTVTTTPATATRLAIVQQPSDSARNGIAFARQPVVEVRDEYGNRVAQAGVQVTATLASGTPALGGTLTVSTAADGRATFDALAITGDTGVRTIGFAATAMTSAVSTSIVVAHGSAAALRFLVQPGAVASGAAIAPAVELEVVDGSGNRVLDAAGSASLAILAQPGYSASLSGTTTAAFAAGRAVFPNLVASGSAGLAYTLRASSGALVANSVTFAITAGTASTATSTLVVDDATLLANGSSFTTVRVRLRDAQGNPLGSGAGYTVAFAATSGTISNVANVGDGTFTARLTAPATTGTATVSATLDGAAIAQPVTVGFVAGPVQGFRVEKLGGGDIGFAGVSEAFQVRVTALDASGNTATTFGGTVSFSTTPSATITQGATSASFSSGVLTAHSVAIGAAGSYTLTATRSGGAETGTSAAFVIDAAPTIVSVVPALDAANVSRTTPITLTFSEPVNASAASFSLQCPSGTPQAFTLSASPATVFTLTPAAALPGGTTCVVRTSAAGGGITDVDAYDPPDGIADGVWAQFTTASAIALVDDDWSADSTKFVTGNVIYESNRATTPFSPTDNDTLPASAIVSWAGYISGGTASAGGTERGGAIMVIAGDGPARGRFLYSPPAGFEGIDRFQYVVVDGPSSDTATVSLRVSGMVWFVDNAAQACTTRAQRCGTLELPYSSLAAFQAENDGVGDNPGPNDDIFLFERATAYTGRLALLAGQKLIGQDATESLSQITGIVPTSGSRAFPAMNAANATRVRITAADRVVSLGTDNTLRGLTIVPTSEMLGPGIGGTNFGTLTVAGDVVVDGVGATAIVLSNGTIAGSFASVRSTGGVAGGVMLTNVGTAGTTTFGVATDTLRSTTGAVVQVNGGSGSFAFPGVITNTAGTMAIGLVIQNVTGGAITFSGPINPGTGAGGSGIRIQNNSGGTFTFSGPSVRTRSSVGIDLQNNTGATIAFTGGGLDVFGETGSVPFNATGGGTLFVLDPTSRNELSSNGAAALNVSGMTIAAAGLNFTRITAVGIPGGFTAMSGISIASPSGTGGLTVSGTGTDGSGGNILYMTGNGVTVTGASSPFRLRLAWMNLTGNSNGISVNGPHDVVVRRSAIANTGTYAGTYGVSATAWTAASSFTLDTVSITNSYAGAIRASASGSTMALTVRGSTITGTNTAGGGSLVDVSGNGPVDVSISGSTLSGGLVNQFRYSGMGGGRIRLDANTISRTTTPMYTSSELVRIQPGVGGTQTAGLTYEVTSNTIPSAVGTTAIYAVAAGVGSGVEIAGRIRNNRIGTAGVANSCSEGIALENYGSGIHTALVSDNVLTMCANRALYATMWGSSIPTTGSRLNATFRGNTVTSSVQPLGVVLSGTANTGRTLCVDATANSLAASAESWARSFNVFLDASTVQLPGYAGSLAGGAPATSTDIVNYLRARNTVNAVAAQATTAAGTQLQGSAQGISACPVPTF